MYNLFFKRLIDFLAAAILLTIFLPVMLVIYITLLIINRDNPIYQQPRAGKYGETFVLLKFKTMTDLRDSEGNLAEDQLRLTKFGRVLRKTSLDELPQLINVLTGKMSLIGPRPLFIKYLPYYFPEEQKRHLVRPGISGWAQVNGRNNLDWNQRLAFDVFYTKNISAKLDLLIAYKTVINILLAKDVVVDESYLIADLDQERKYMDDTKPNHKTAVLQ